MTPSSILLATITCACLALDVGWAGTGAETTGTDPVPGLNDDGAFIAPGWRIEPERGFSLALAAFSTGGPGGRDRAPLWVMNIHHGPYVVASPSKAARRFRRVFTIQDEEKGCVYELCHVTARGPAGDVGCWVARCLQASGPGLRIRILNRNGLLTAGTDGRIGGGDSMGFGMRGITGSTGDSYRVGAQLFAYPDAPPVPGQREYREHDVTPGTRFVSSPDSSKAFTLWLGGTGSMTIRTSRDSNRIPRTVLESSTGASWLDLWWAPGDASSPTPDSAADDWIPAAVRRTLAACAPDRVRISMKVIDGLQDMARAQPGILDRGDIKGTLQAFQTDVVRFETLCTELASPGRVLTPEDWIALGSLTEGIEEARTTLEVKIVALLLP